MRTATAGALRVKPPIGQALAADVLQRVSRTIGVGEAELGASVPTEVKLSHVALKMLFANMMERADQTALQQSEARFDGVGRHIAARVFLRGVVHNVMRREVLADFLVDAGLIRHQRGLLGDLRIEDRAQRLRADVGNVEGTLLAVALDQRDYLHLVVIGARAGRLLTLVAPKGLVNFDRAAVATELAFGLDVHGFADAVSHEPRGLVGDAKRAVELVGADALLGRAHQVRRQHPLVKGHLRALKDRADRHRVLAAAVAAEIQARAVRLALQLRLAIRAAAVRADRAIRPAECL